MTVTTNVPIVVEPGSTKRYTFSDGFTLDLPPITFPEKAEERFKKIESELAEMRTQLLAIRDLLSRKGIA